MDPETDNLDSILATLQSKVSSFTASGAGSASVSSFVSGISLKKSYMYYVAVPIIVLIGLAVFKPRFVTHEVSDNGDAPVVKLSIKKMMIATLIFSIPICAGIYFAGARTGSG